VTTTAPASRARFLRLCLDCRDRSAALPVFCQNRSLVLHFGFFESIDSAGLRLPLASICSPASQANVPVLIPVCALSPPAKLFVFLRVRMLLCSSCGLIDRSICISGVFLSYQIKKLKVSWFQSFSHDGFSDVAARCSVKCLKGLELNFRSFFITILTCVVATNDLCFRCGF
jgi:hypothetical protein